MQTAFRHIFPYAAILLTPGIANATDGYFMHGYGVKAQGVGGAAIAFPQDGLAAASNPAGTALVGDRLDLGVTWFRPDRGAEITGNSFPGVDGSLSGNGRQNFFIPEIGYTKQLSPTVGVGLAVYGNGGLNTKYDNGVPLFGGSPGGVNLEQAFITPSIAWKPFENHSIGLGVNIAYQRFKANGLQNFDNPFFSSSPGNVTNRGTDTSWGAGVRLGWIGQVTPTLSLGATWASKVYAQRFERYRGLFADEGGFDVPENYGVGLAWKVTPSLTFAADVTEIRYSGVRSVGNPLSFAGGQLGDAGGPGFGWRDATVYKLGLAYELNERATLRVGYNHTDQPIPSSQTLFNILAPGVVRDHVTLGGTWRFSDGSELSASYLHAFKETVNGHNSIPPGFPPAGFGGGEANLHMSQNALGIAYAIKF